MRVTPLHDRLIVQRIEDSDQIVGGIVIPDSAKEKPQRGTVLAVGLGRIREDGSRQQPDVRTATQSCSGGTRARRSRSAATTT
jgi:chaperonin GroES